jgi:hypothetical protein
MPVKKSGIRTQEFQELQNMRARSLSENPGQASPRENLRRNPGSLAPELLNSGMWSQEHRQVSEELQEFRSCRMTRRSGILRLRKRKLQLLPLHFAFSSRQTAKAPAFAYARTDFAKILLKVLRELPIENF